MTSLSVTSFPSISNLSFTSSSSSIYSPSRLNPPFGLDFHKDNDQFEFDNDNLSQGYRKGGPKEARLRKVALMSSTKEVEHLHPIKIKNIPESVSPETIKKEFEEFGKVEDIYIPIDPQRRKPIKDFAVIRFADKEAAEKALSFSNEKKKSIDGKELILSPLDKQNSFFSNGTGYHGISNEVIDDGSRAIVKKAFCEQDIPLSSCMARSGYPWTSLRELKVFKNLCIVFLL